MRYLAIVVLFATVGTALGNEKLQLSGRYRQDDEVLEKKLEWDASKTAVIICDMWDQHWCQGATRRCGEIAPRINELINAVRAKGGFIVHAPSDTMKTYEGTPGRKLAQSAPPARLEPPVPTGPPTNSAPNPYRTMTGWLQLPAGRVLGSTGGVAIDKRGHVWVAERCGGAGFVADCGNSTLNPIFEFDSTGKVLHNFGSGLLVFPHGIGVDRLAVKRDAAIVALAVEFDDVFSFAAGACEMDLEFHGM